MPGTIIFGSKRDDWGLVFLNIEAPLKKAIYNHNNNMLPVYERLFDVKYNFQIFPYILIGYALFVTILNS